MTEFVEDLEINLEFGPKKYKKKEPGEYARLNQYAKKQILTYLQKNGSDKAQCEKLLKKFKCDPSELETFVNTHAKNSQNGVQIECDSMTLRSILGWIEGFRDSGLNLAGANELPLIMKTISHLETHPLPEECGGIDFGELYLFIGNVMNGEPTLELNEKNRNFLCDILGELVDDINNSEGDMNTLKLRDELLNQYPKDKKGTTLEEQMLQIGLNPLMLQFF